MAKVIATDRRTSFRDSIQQTIVGNLVTLIEVDCTSFGGSIYRFHNHAIPPVKISEGRYEAAKVSLGGKVYRPYPYGVSSISYDSAQAPEPTLVVGNVDNLISALCLTYEDLVNAKVTLTTTLSEYLDGGERPNPEEGVRSIWYIANKTSEDDEQVSFKLTSPADVEGSRLPSRVITGHCTWALRGWYKSGKGCGYMGAAMFDVEDNPVTDPSKDVCGGLFNSCKIRFGSNPLDFGGFPAASLIDK